MTMDTGHVFEAPPASQAPVRRASVAKSAAAWLRGFSRAAFSTSLASSTSRMRIVALAFLGLYGVIGGRLIYLGFKPDPANLRRAAAEAVAASRPDLLDRNGEILATDVKTMSVFAEPRRHHRQGRGGRAYHRRAAATSTPRSCASGSARRRASSGSSAK